MSGNGTRAGKPEDYEPPGSTTPSSARWHRDEFSRSDSPSHQKPAGMAPAALPGFFDQFPDGCREFEFVNNSVKQKF
jgi:hypothetical protein